MTTVGFLENKFMELEHKFESRFKEMENSIGGQQEQISKLQVKLKNIKTKLKMGHQKIKALESKLQSTEVNDLTSDVSTEPVVSTETVEPQYLLRNGHETTDYDDSEYYNDYGNMEDYDGSYEDTDNVMSDVTMNFHKDGDTTEEVDTTAYDDIIAAVAGGKLGGNVKSFSCTICPKIYTARSSLKKHMLTHQKRPFNCTKCAEYFAEENQLNLHLQKHVEERSRVGQPSETSEASASNVASSDNQKSKTPKKIQTPRVPNPGYSFCRICKVFFSAPFKLTAHFKTHHPSEKAFECSTCLKFFDFKKEYNHHMKITHGPKKGEKTTSKRPTPNTKSNHLDPSTELHQCMICSKVFRKEELLYKHFEVHAAAEGSGGGGGGGSKVSRQKGSKSKSVVDTVDDAMDDYDDVESNGYYDPSDLNFTGGQNSADDSHLQAENWNEDEMAFVCSFCDDGIPFPDRKSLLKHVNEDHAWQKGFKCQFCPKSYFTSHFLDRHIKSRHKSSIKLRQYKTKKSKN